MNRIFISGSISIKNINGPIISRLDNIIRNGHEILIGDADGVDKSIQTILANRSYKNVVVYCSGGSCRNNVGKWNVANVPVPPSTKGRKFYMLKDDQMALDADYGFLIWDGKSAGTINNLSNLIKLGKVGLVYFIPLQIFITIKDKESFHGLLSKCNSNDIDNIDKKISFRKKLENQEMPAPQELSLELFKADIASYSEASKETAALSVNENSPKYKGMGKVERK
jgi:hypothetical protein